MPDDLQTLIDEATPAPESTPDFAALTSRAQRRTTIGTAVASLAAIATLIAGGVMLWPGVPGRAPAIDQAPATDSAGDPSAPALPAGWQEIEVGEASFGVPGDWTIETFGPEEPFCENSPTTPTAMLAPQGRPSATCTLQDYVATTLTAQPLSTMDAESDLPRDRDATARAAGDLAGREVSHSDEQLTFWSEDADIFIQVGGPRTVRDIAEQILATLAPVDANRAMSDPDTGTEVTGWSTLPRGPLSARYGALTAWVDGGLVAFGGRSDEPCPPGARCVLPDAPSLVDGARWTRADGWREIPPMPTAFQSATTAVIRDVVYVLGTPWPGTDGAPLIGFNVTSNEWEELPLPAGRGPDLAGQIAAGDDELLLFQRSHERGRLPDLRFDPADQSWSELPRDPLPDSYDRDLTSLDGQLIATGIPVGEVGSDGPATYRAAVWTPAEGWRQLPPGDVAGWSPDWFAVGDRLVNPATGTVDGGQVNPYDRPYALGGMLDPRTGIWSQLPEGAPDRSGGWSLAAVGDGDLLVPDGGHAALIDNARTWVPLDPPPDAPTDLISAAVGDGQLYVVGGVSWTDATHELSANVWVWTPPAQ